MPEQSIVPNLWFDTQAEDAAQYYIDVLGSGRVTGVVRYPEGAPGPAGSVMAVEFEAGGMRFVGWLEDRYGLAWQVQPVGMTELFADPDPARAKRAVQAMLGMRKLDLAALQAAADGAPVR